MTKSTRMSVKISDAGTAEAFTDVAEYMGYSRDQLIDEIIVRFVNLVRVKVKGDLGYNKETG